MLFWIAERKNKKMPVEILALILLQLSGIAGNSKFLSITWVRSPLGVQIKLNMSTSANVIEYLIEKNGKEVGNFRKNIMCKFPEYSDLLKYQPLSDYDITPHG